MSAYPRTLSPFALAATIALGAAPAQAMHLSPDHRGQVLIVPYYTVKAGWDTLFHLTNLSDRTAIAKVRFREALNGRPVTSLNVILSPYDVWTATVTEGSVIQDAYGKGAVLRTYDSTCTSPLLPASPTAAGAREIAFSTSAFDGSLGPDFPQYANDGAPSDSVRTQEGFFEVLLLGTSTRDPDSGNVNPVLSTHVVEYHAKHVNGTPRDCAKVDAAFADLSTNFPGFIATGNVLRGASALIAVGNGSAVDQPVTHIENWRNAAQIHAGDSAPPTYADGTDGTAYWLDTTEIGETALWRYTGTPVDAVSALLSAKEVTNEFAANGTGTFTDWVMTFPTKHHYTDLWQAEFANQSEGLPPFAQNFNYFLAADNRKRGQACDWPDVPVYWDRNEKKVTSGTYYLFPQRIFMCYAVTTTTINGSHIFGDYMNHPYINTTSVGLGGVLKQRIPNTGHLPGIVKGLNTSNQFIAEPPIEGLPVIGFATILRKNAAEAGNNRNYGTSQAHSLKRRSTSP